MPFHRLTYLLVLGLAALALRPANLEAHPRLVRVSLEPSLGITRLVEEGFDVVERRGRSAWVLEWPGDHARLLDLGATVEVVDDHPGRTAAKRTADEQATRAKTKGALPPFGSGSLGGYWTLAEVKMKLDELVAGDVSNVVAGKLDTLGTSIQGRPIWGLKLGKALPGPELRPVVFLNALTHAREPEGMQALLYFVDDLLAKYGQEPTATYLLDHRVIYVVPVVNPDGYRYNQQVFDGSGGTEFGYWRKNMRDNNGNFVFETNVDGVDLNRNYGFQWGLNNVGSSGNPSSGTYRGTGPFSEPETRAQRDSVIALRPKTGISFHTYGDLLLHPWGWTSLPTADSAKFYEWDDHMSLGNGYQTGQSTRVLYEVNGEFNDWCYGDTIGKPRAFTWTPEVGGPDDGFWPPPSRIVPLAEENLRACYVAAAIAGPYVRVQHHALVEGVLNAGGRAHLTLRARNKGLGAAGPGLSATLNSLSAGAQVLIATLSLPDLAPLTSGDLAGVETFVLAADDSVTPGRVLRFRVDFTAPNGYFSRDTIEVLCGTPTVLAADGASSGTGQWTTGWGIVTGDPVHPSSYFADSPLSDYPEDSDNPLELNATLDLSSGVHAYVLYEARWEFEENWDCGLIEASLDGVSWTPIASGGTSLGKSLSGGTQPGGLPVYDGAHFSWRSERADLSAFAGALGAATRIRFRARSDGFSNFDGLNVDSVRIVVFDPIAQPEPVAVGASPDPTALDLGAPTPNPARGFVRFEFAVPSRGLVRLEVLDVQGRHLRTLADLELSANRYVRGWDARDDTGSLVPPGVYWARLSGTSGSIARRFIVMH